MRPNDYSINTQYATLKNDAKGVVSIAIPSNISLSITNITLKASVKMGQKSAGMIYMFTSSKYPNSALLSSQVLIPCTMSYTSTSGQKTIDTSLNAYVYRSSITEVTMEIAPNIPGDISGNTVTVTNAAQTVSCHISTFLSPFEA